MDKFIWYDIAYSNDRFIDLLNNQSDLDYVILYSIEESLNWELLFNTNLKEKINLLNGIPFKIIVNNTCTFDSYDGIEFLKIEPFLLKTVFRIENGQDTNPKWNFNSDKALIFTGKPNKENRIGFLIECVKSGILKNHIYSFFPPIPEKYLEKTKEIFYKLCNWDYDEFCKEYQNNPDNINIRNKDDIHYSGFPYSVDLYKQTCISVILETNTHKNGDNFPDYSEKTYKAIINKHPFLMINEPNSLWMLKKYGFYTFEEYMQNPKYDLIENIFKKNREVVKNLNYFLKNYHTHIDEINEKIEHNYNLMFKIYEDFKNEHKEIYEALSQEFFKR